MKRSLLFFLIIILFLAFGTSFAQDLSGKTKIDGTNLKHEKERLLILRVRSALLEFYYFVEVECVDREQLAKNDPKKLMKLLEWESRYLDFLLKLEFTKISIEFAEKDLPKEKENLDTMTGPWVLIDKERLRTNPKLTLLGVAKDNLDVTEKVLTDLQESKLKLSPCK